MWKIDSGEGSFSGASLSYRPVLGVRKSGMPAEVLIPAPVRTIIRVIWPVLIRSAMDWMVGFGGMDILLNLGIADVMCEICC